MKTLKADDYQRVRIPDALPRQVFAYQPETDGSFHLIPVKVEAGSPAKVTIRRRKGRHSVGRSGRVITSDQVKAVLTDVFP